MFVLRQDWAAGAHGVLTLSLPCCLQTCSETEGTSECFRLWDGHGFIEEWKANLAPKGDIQLARPRRVELGEIQVEGHRGHRRGGYIPEMVKRVPEFPLNLKFSSFHAVAI